MAVAGARKLSQTTAKRNVTLLHQRTHQPDERLATMILQGIKSTLTAITASVALFISNPQATATDLMGRVQGAGSPIAGSTVTLYVAREGAPTELAKGKSDDNGAFKLNFAETPKGSVLYLISKGGTPKAAASKGG